ncbi:FHA domain-containing protein [Streptomyces sp. V4-01]|uniref:FHA domain-containing protein n=1 Tax=Actinacidiphila polyblastidii TaxID=3110430 RepID=A0ABU7PI77_9ACTN|nr:FHA domain-containing protein [Streptomyces sp. V4-01]
MRAQADAGTCPECGTTGAQAGQLVCRGCFVPFALMPAARGPAAGPVGPNARAGGDPDATDALPQAGQGAAAADSEHTRIINVIPGALPRSAKTRRDAPARALRLSFPSGEIVAVQLGEQIRLGREPQFCPAVAFLAAHDNLSRLHATVGVELDGSAWIVDEGSTNGTFVHGYRLTARERASLRPGDKVRLAADVTIRIMP